MLCEANYFGNSHALSKQNSSPISEINSSSSQFSSSFSSLSSSVASSSSSLSNSHETNEPCVSPISKNGIHDSHAFQESAPRTAQDNQNKKFKRSATTPLTVRAAIEKSKRANANSLSKNELAKDPLSIDWLNNSNEENLHHIHTNNAKNSFRKTKTSSHAKISSQSSPSTTPMMPYHMTNENEAANRYEDQAYFFHRRNLNESYPVEHVPSGGDSMTTAHHFSANNFSDLSNHTGPNQCHLNEGVFYSSMPEPGQSQVVYNTDNELACHPIINHQYSMPPVYQQMAPETSELVSLNGTDTENAGYYTFSHDYGQNGMQLHENRLG